MSVWAIVPVKPFLQSKSRLASILSPEARAGLSRDFLTRTLQVLNEISLIKGVVVISRDPEALALARAWGARAIVEPDASDLNEALTLATAHTVENGASAVLVLPTDLPRLSAAAVSQLIDSDITPLIRLAPDRHGFGTNALFMRPPNLISYAFGPGSLQRHQALAARAGVPARLCPLPALELDVDTPEDLRVYGESKHLYK